MEKFAIITFPNSDDKVVERTGVLGKLSRKIVELYKYIRGPRLVDTVIDRKSKVELGKIYNIPTLHYNKSGLVFDDRKRQIKLLIKELHENNIGILSGPFIANILDREDVIEFNKNGIEVLDPSFFQICTLYSCFPELLKILNKQIPYMDVGIWRADTELGEAWVHMFAPYLNSMTIGGKDLDILYRISDRVLRETGLACEVTTSFEKCLEGKDISVMTEETDLAIFKDMITILSYPKNVKSLNDIDNPFVFYSGLLELPCEPVLDVDLDIWECLALSHSLLYILSGSYRKLTNEVTLNIESLENFLQMIRSYPLSKKGLVNNYETITYDRFRMIYFNDRSIDIKVG